MNTSTMQNHRPGAHLRKDTEFVVALGRQQRRPQLSQHCRRMLQSIHELIVVLSNVKDRHTRSETDNYQSSDVKDRTHSTP